MNKYDRLPADMQPHARDYVERHRAVGGFLTAVLENNFVDAIGKADAENRVFIEEWALWLFNDIPSKCWGSKDKVEAWLAAGEEDDEDEGVPVTADPGSLAGRIASTL